MSSPCILPVPYEEYTTEVGTIHKNRPCLHSQEQWRNTNHTHSHTSHIKNTHIHTRIHFTSYILCDIRLTHGSGEEPRYFLCSSAPVSMSINGRSRGRLLRSTFLVEADDLENLISIQVPRSREKRVEQKEGGVLHFLFQNGWK